jgi:hypothetical protein
MDMKKKLFTLFFLAGLASCKNAPKQEQERTDGFNPVLKTREDSLFHDVMEGHDMGMARMGKISRYLSQVQKALDSLNKLPASKVDTKYQQFLIDLQKELNYADYGMNTWMEEFKVDSAKGEKEKRIQYLEAEKVKIQKVKESIIGSLKRADSLFGK